MAFVLVALGSAAGGALRYATSLALPAPPGQGFPWATFVVNAVGCLCIGVVHEAASSRGLDPQVRLFLATGVLGGFTTFSSFGLETVNLAAHRPMLAAANIVGQLVVGLGAVVVGIGAARYVAG